MNKILQKFLDISLAKGTGHLGPSLSALPIMNALYERYDFERENLFILSKGHAALGYYTVLHHHGFIADSEFQQVYNNGSEFCGHISRNPEKGIVATAGSLGHGAPLAAGLAMANPDKKVFCLIGDGECDEGSVWEALSFISRNKLKNVNIIIDYNTFQGYDKLLERTLPKKLDAFGMNIKYCLNFNSFKEELERSEKAYSYKPNCFVVYTDKTGGFNCLDGMSSHYRKMDQELYNEMMGELE